MPTANLDWLDDTGTVKKDFAPVETQDKLTRLAAEYSFALAKKLNDVDASSSGDLADSIQPLAIQVKGKVFYVDIVAAKYASFIDEGIDGWANSRDSRFKFKTRGVDPKGEMVKSIKDYLVRENKMAQTKYSVLHKKGKIKDKQIAAATSVAYMIKRMGIKATHFWRDATSEFSSIVEKELGMAVKIDIINNFK